MSAEFIRHELLRHESIRESSFQNWTSSDVNYHKLVNAGFYYESNGDEVICFSCGIRISGWTSSSHAYLMHRSFSPACPFLAGKDISINRLPAGNYPSAVAFPLIPSSVLSIQNTSLDIERFSLKQPPFKEVKKQYSHGNPNLKEIEAYFKMPIKIPASNKPNLIINIDDFFIMMKNEETRLETFKIRPWPLKFPTPEALSKSGFFYCLVNDSTQCAYCRCIIGGWKLDSSPKEVHKNLFPHCSFIKQLEQLNSLFEAADGNEVEIIGEVLIQDNKLDEIKNRLLCKICFDNEISVRFSCKHMISCKNCSIPLNHCPICRAVIRRKYDVIIC